MDKKISSAIEHTECKVNSGYESYDILMGFFGNKKWINEMKRLSSLRDGKGHPWVRTADPL